MSADVVRAPGPEGLPGSRTGQDRELATYLRELPRLLAEGHAGRYALIRDEEILSVWDTQGDVLQAGYERFGMDHFAVKRIEPRDPGRMAAIQATESAACPS